MDLARDATLELNRGVLVDDHMRTSDPQIYAAGDVVEYGGSSRACGRPRSPRPRWRRRTPRAATPYKEIPPVTILKVVGIELTSIGRFEAGAGRGGDRARGGGAGRYRKLVIADGKIAGAILLGSGNDVAAVRTAITKGVDVTPHLEALRGGNWGVLESLG